MMYVAIQTRHTSLRTNAKIQAKYKEPRQAKTDEQKANLVNNGIGISPETIQSIDI